LNIIGGIAALTNGAVDVIYAFRTRYVLASMFYLTCVFLALRLLCTIIAGTYYYCKHVIQYRGSMRDLGEGKNMEDGAEED